jgi:polar amino acid transport system substrate-binding protein
MRRPFTVSVGFAICVFAMSARAQNIAPAGSLRAVFLGSNPVQGRMDQKTGAVTGPAADLMAGLAKSLNVSFTLKGVANVKAVIDAIRGGDADAGFLAFDASRAEEVSYSRPYSLVLNNYLVLANSPLRDAAAVDREGIRVGVEKNISADLFLTRTLQHAKVMRTDTLSAEEILQKIDAKEFDAWAANKQRLIDMTAGSARYRILSDSFLSVGQCIVVAKGNQPLLDAVNRFLEGALGSGFVQKSLVGAGLTGVEPAPRP